MDSKNQLKSTHQGELTLNGFQLSCAVLDDKNKTRVFSERTIATAFGIKGGGSYWERKKEGSAYLPEYLSANYLKPFITKELELKFDGAIKYISKSGTESNGVDVTILPEICDVYIQAKNSGLKNKNLLKASDIAYSLMKGFATVGIVALVDEATGYQDVRVKDALQEILKQYLLEDAKRYQVTFPVELYKQWFRLNNWEWKEQNAQKRPGVIGTWTNKYIYERIAPNILKELERKNPKNEKGYRDYKHFQFLTDEVGEPKLREFFGGLIALARATSSWRKYTELVERAYPKIGDQLDLFIEED